MFELKEFIEKALQRYRNKLAKKKEQEIVPTFYQWQLPEQRQYNEDTHEAEKTYMHAMLPFYK